MIFGTKYQQGVKYSNGERTITFNYRSGRKMFFSENGKRQPGIDTSTFSKLKFEPIEEISKGGIKTKSVMSKEEYRKGNKLFFSNEE